MKEYLSISEMAEIHNISRQTLIYYDKIGLFKPKHTDVNGYRYYCPYQIPFLREICFLKSIGITLEDIKEHINNRNLTTVISLLEYHKQFIDKKISNLLKTSEFIQQRLKLYTTAEHFKEELSKPTIEELPERKVVFFPFENRISRQELHLTLMKTWNVLVKNEQLPAVGFGTIIRQEELGKAYIFEGAGVYSSLPLNNCNVENVISLPPGHYACMYKYGMPYDTEPLLQLIQWINDNGYRICGDIVDACLLDTTFYEADNNVDFCQIQIPVEK